MKKASGRVFKYGDNVDTDVIIPARYLNSSDPADLATHCMEDIDKDFVKKVQKGDIIVATKNFGCGMHPLPLRRQESIVLSLKPLLVFFIETLSTSVCRSSSAGKRRWKFRTKIW